MTRLAVLSDIHGILPALQAVLADAVKYEVDGYILAGDYTAGPFQEECIRIQRALRGWTILGNGELNLRKYDRGQAPPGWSDCLQFALLRHSYDHPERDTLDYLASLPEQVVVQVDGLASIRVVHGSPRSPYEEIFTPGDTHPLATALAETHEQVLVCGHTHIPWLVERAGKMAFNPGSVGGPLNGFVGAHSLSTLIVLPPWQGFPRLQPYRMKSGSMPKPRLIGKEYGFEEEFPRFHHRDRPGHALPVGRGRHEDFSA